MKEHPGDPEAALELAVTREFRALIGELSRRLREKAHPGDFTCSQVATLEREGSRMVATLARAGGMRPQSMGANVSVLEAAGLVSGAPDPSDGRQIPCSLTAVARVDITAERAARADWLFRAIRTRLSSGEKQELATAIELLKCPRLLVVRSFRLVSGRQRRCRLRGSPDAQR
jgi:DNA-binding MarR family transcriptional regulator